MLKKAKDSLPRIKAGSHNTTQAIRMLLWQDIAVLVNPDVLLLQLAWSYFAVIMNINFTCIYMLASSTQRDNSRSKIKSVQ